MGRRAVPLNRYVLKDRAGAPFIEGVRTYSLSGDRKKLLYQAGGGADGGHGVSSVRTDPDASATAQSTSRRSNAFVDPRAEWAQIFKETGAFSASSSTTRRCMVPTGTRCGRSTARSFSTSDTATTLATSSRPLAGELVVGHSYLTGPGDEPADTPVNVGMLGADFRVENGRYRITRIYSGENWNPELRAPLSAPGIQVATGDYVLEVNGAPIAPPTNIYKASKAPRIARRSFASARRLLRKARDS